MSQAQEGSPEATIAQLESVPHEYKAVDANDEARLHQLHPDMAYICGQAPRRPDDANYEYVKSEMKVFRSTLFALVGNTWLLRDFRYYVRSLTYLGFEATRALLLHLLLHFEKGPNFPLPDISHRYISQFFRTLRDRDRGKASDTIPSSQDDLDGKDNDSNDSNPHAPCSEPSASSPKRGAIDLDVQATLKIYEGAYSDSGYSGFGCQPETMTQLIHYMVEGYMTNLKVHAGKSMVVCLRRHIIFDITKDNILYTGRRRRRRSRKDGYVRANGGGGQTRNQRIARREWRRLVAAGNLPRWKAVERANAVIAKLSSPTAKCDLDDWNKYGAKHSKAKTIAQKLRVIYDTNLDLRKAKQSTVTLIPLYSASAKYVTVDSTALFEVLMEFEKHYSEKRCKTDCECCNDDEPFKRSTTDDKRFRWNRIRHWLEFVKVPYDLLLGKDEEAEPGRRYFNTMLSTDGFGASLSTFKWVRRKLSEQTPEAPTALPGPSAVESSAAAPTTSAPMSSAPMSSAPSAAESSTAGGKRRRTPEPALKIGCRRVVLRVPSPVPAHAPSPESPPQTTAPPTDESSTSAPTTVAPPAPVSKHGRGCPRKSATQLPPATAEFSSVGVKRKRTPRSASTAEGEPVVPRVIARAGVRRPGPEPPPPAYLRAMAELAADPYDGLLPASASDEAADAMLAAVVDDLAECTAALSELRAVCLASHAEGEAAAHWAASIDHAEYYTEHKRTAIYNEKCEAVTIAYETAIRVAEVAAGPELERTEAQAEALNIARDAAMKTALRGVDVSRFVASEAIYAEKRKAAAAFDALRQPSHVRIGGDPGVKTFLELACFDEPEWSCSFSAKQYHADSG
ncbi:hypothetical protein H4R27_005804, partial [Coemansia aciculifera]